MRQEKKSQSSAFQKEIAFLKQALDLALNEFSLYRMNILLTAKGSEGQAAVDNLEHLVDQLRQSYSELLKMQSSEPDSVYQDLTQRIQAKANDLNTTLIRYEDAVSICQFLSQVITSTRKSLAFLGS